MPPFLPIPLALGVSEAGCTLPVSCSFCRPGVRDDPADSHPLPLDHARHRQGRPRAASVLPQTLVPSSGKETRVRISIKPLCEEGEAPPWLRPCATRLPWGGPACASLRRDPQVDSILFRQELDWLSSGTKVHRTEC